MKKKKKHDKNLIIITNFIGHKKSPEQKTPGLQYL